MTALPCLPAPRAVARVVVSAVLERAGLGRDSGVAVGGVGSHGAGHHEGA